MLNSPVYQPLRFVAKQLIAEIFTYLPARRNSISLPSPGIILISEKDPRDLFLLVEILQTIHTGLPFTFHFNNTLKSFSQILQNSGFIPPILLPPLKKSHTFLQALAKINPLQEKTISTSTDDLVERILKSLQAGHHYLLYESECLPDSLEDVLLALVKAEGSERFLDIQLTYDYITAIRSNVHIAFSQPFVIQNDDNTLSDLQQIRKRQFTMTPGHLLSYAIYSNDMQTGLSRQFLFYKMNRLANALYREKTCRVSRECLEYSYDELFAVPLKNAKDLGYLDYLEKRYCRNRKSENTRTKWNPFFRHYLDLEPIQTILDKLWREAVDYD